MCLWSLCSAGTTRGTGNDSTDSILTLYAADISAVREAAGRLFGIVHRTPVMTCSAIDHLAGRHVFFKCENLQKVGAFKFRGACNFVGKLPEESVVKGVVTHSSGNHAQAVALAARMKGVDAHIVMPENAAPVKQRAVESYGGRIVFCAPTLEAREKTAAKVLAETGGTFIHPYDHPDIIAGQGTAALELLGQVDGLEAIVAPVGGGGLISGTCITAKSVRPAVQVFAAEPSGADDAARSKQAGKRILQTGPDTIADGLLTSLGEMTWPIIRDQVERVITVNDDQIISAMRLFWERAKLLIEASAAVAVAAVLSREFKALRGIKRVGVILSGGNADLDNLPW